MLELRASAGFKRDVKKCKKQHYDLALLEEVISLIRENSVTSKRILAQRHNDHALKGQLSSLRECHIANAGDWILIYVLIEAEGFVEFVATGSHDDFFRERKNADRFKPYI